MSDEIEQGKARIDADFHDGSEEFELEHSAEDEGAKEKKETPPEIFVPTTPQGSEWSHDEEVVKYGDLGDFPLDEALPLSPQNNAFFAGEAGEAVDRVDPAKSPEEIALWIETLGRSFAMLIRDGGMDQAVARAGAVWNTALQHEDIRLTPRKHSLGNLTDNRKLVGVDALAKATAFTTVGAIVQIPLYHSGIWVTLKAPSDGALLEIERQLAIDRVEFGRLTHGKIFSLSESVLRGNLAKFAIEHIVESTLDFKDKTDFYNNILLLDLPYLIAGLALAIYPAGYPIVQPCLASPTTCNYVAQGKSMISKMMRVDNSAFAPAQIAFMANRNRRVKHEELTKYREMFEYKESTVAGLVGDKVKIRYKSPSLAEYFEEGYRWVAELEAATERSFGAKISLNERNDQISATAAASAMRQYSHWVERITYLDQNEVETSSVVEKQALFETLERFSADDAISDGFFTSVKTFINSRTISLIAIPDFVCPKCQKLQNDQATGRFRWLIPQDAVSTFFTVLHHRTSRIARRTDI